MTDDALARNVRALAAHRGWPAAAMYETLRVSRGTWQSRLRGTTAWTAAEVVALAAMFDVTVEDLHRPDLIP